MVEGKPTFAARASDIIELFSEADGERRIIVGFNIAFDITVLRYELELLGLTIPPVTILDTRGALASLAGIPSGVWPRSVTPTSKTCSSRSADRRPSRYRLRRDHQRTRRAATRTTTHTCGRGVVRRRPHRPERFDVDPETGDDFDPSSVAATRIRSESDA